MTSVDPAAQAAFDSEMVEEISVAITLLKGPRQFSTRQLEELLREMAAAYLAKSVPATSIDSQLVEQAEELWRKSRYEGDLSVEGPWMATESDHEHLGWRVTAERTARIGGGSRTVLKAVTPEPAVAGLLTFMSTALPRLCALARAGVEKGDAGG